MLIPEERRHQRDVLHETALAESEAYRAGEFRSPVNILTGEVIAIHRGLLHMGIRVRIGERTTLRVRSSLDEGTDHGVVIGERVRVLIPAHAIHLEAGYFRLGKQRWNRWIGRIVRVKTMPGDRMITIKLHGDAITFTSSGLLTGSNWTPHTWDTVNVVVDPTKVGLVTAPQRKSVKGMSRHRESAGGFLDARVWLNAQIMDIEIASEGRLLSLLIGSAQVSVCVSMAEDHVSRWAPGMAVEVHVGRYEAWLKPRSSEGQSVLCRLLYRDRHTDACGREEL